MIFRQYWDQYPISFPPNKVIFCGNKSEGKKIIDIKIIPEKKENENKKFLNPYETDDDSYFLDLDTPEDFTKWLSRFG